MLDFSIYLYFLTKPSISANFRMRRTHVSLSRVLSTPPWETSISSCLPRSQYIYVFSVLISLFDIGILKKISSSNLILSKIWRTKSQLWYFRCPKTVENFCVHSKNGYYNSHVFHRVIKGFMIQTGDPLGMNTSV